MRLSLFLKRNCKYILLVILLSGMLAGIYKVLSPGHVLNGDFALYIRQAASIIEGDMQNVGEDMQSMIAASTYQRYSPVLYPWGFPMLLSPMYYVLGVNYMAFKIVVICCMLLAFIFLYLRIQMEDKKNRGFSLFVIAVTSGNIFYWYFGNYVSSESAYFCFLSLSFLLINVLYYRKCFCHPAFFLVLGILLFFVSQVRTEGYFLLLSLIAVQYKQKTRGKMLWLPYLGVLIGGFMFFYFFPSGYLTHFEHFKVVSWPQIMNNILSFYNYPVSFLFGKQLWLGTLFWSLCLVGIGIGWVRYRAEIIYLLSNIGLLIVWPYAEIRYWFSLFPFCILFALEGLFFCISYIIKYKPEIPFVIIGGILSVWVWTYSFVIVPDKENLYTLADPNVEGYDAKEVFEFIKEYAEKNAWIACGESRTVYLYTGRLCANVFGAVDDLSERFDWYIRFRGRNDYLQYPFGVYRLYRKKFEKVLQNETFTVYKIKHICEEKN